MGREHLRTSSTFIAISCQPDLRLRIADTIERLKVVAKNATGVSWVSSQKAHITLAYLGNISQERLEAAKVACENTAHQTAPFELEIGTVSYFYKSDVGGDSILYLDILDKDKNLRSLYSALANTLSQEKFYPRERIQPHITLARIKQRKKQHEQKELLWELSQAEIGPFPKLPVLSIDIYKNLQPGAGGLRYTLIGKYILSNG